MALEVIPSTCSECLVRCGSLVHVDDGRVVKIAGNPAHPGTQGAFCVKGMNAPQAAREHPDRVLQPLKRGGARGDRKWEPIPWSQALAEIAARLADIKQRHGARAIAGAVPTHAQSRGVAMRQLLRCIGSPNLMINQDQCHGCRATAAMLTGMGGLGAEPGTELAQTRLVMVVGKSPSESNVADWGRLKAAQAAGAHIVVVDPRRTQAARLANDWLQVRPGTDAALALAMIHVILNEQLQDTDFVLRWTTGLDELRARAGDYSPETVEGITGVPAESIVRVARLFATTSPASMILGHGVDAQANGVHTSVAFLSLLALTGNIDRPGSNQMTKKLAGFRDNFINAPEICPPPEVEEQVIGHDRFPLWTGKQSWAKAVHNPTLIDAVLTGQPYPVRAMIVSGTNIACTYPDYNKTIEAFKSLDLLVVAGDQMTPTGEYADYFLPKTTLLEEEDVFSDSAGPCLSLTRRILAPRGDARSDINIAVGLRDELRARGAIDHELMPWNSHDEYNQYLLEETGVTLSDLKATAFHRIPRTYAQYEKNGFRTPSGKFEFTPAQLGAPGGSAAPDYKAPSYASRREGFDLVLLTGIRSMAYQNSRFREHAWARRVQEAPDLRIHPRTAGQRGIVRGDWVWVQTAPDMPRCLLKANLTEEMPEDTVATGMGWWYPELKDRERGAATFNIGVAVRYGPDFDPVSGSAEARNTACRIERADPLEARALLNGTNAPKGPTQ
jgi:anaerobic selenocysteine-containing dehydrogenase